MRSPTKKILVDRLDQALRKHGVELKRSAVIEVMAQAHGLPNSDHLEKAVKAGEIDPPMAAPHSPENRNFAWLLDPVADSVFAYDPDRVTTSRPAMILSPYGNLLSLPDAADEILLRPEATTHGWGTRRASPEVDHDARHRADDAEPWTSGMDDDNRPYQQVGIARDIVPLEKTSTIHRIEGLEEHGLQRFEDLVDLDVDLEPFISMSNRGVSLVDGRINLTFSHSIATNEGHTMGRAIDEMQSLASHAAEWLIEAGCVLRWTEDSYFGSLDVNLYVPEDAIEHLRDGEELTDALIQTLDGPRPGHHLLKPMATGIRSSIPDANPIASWAEANAAKGHRFGRVPEHRIETNREASRIAKFRRPLVQVSDRPGESLTINDVSTVDGVPHLEVRYSIPCWKVKGMTTRSRSEAGVLINRMHDGLVELTSAKGAVMRRINLRDEVVLSIHFPFEVMASSGGMDDWAKAVGSILRRSRDGTDDPIDFSNWPAVPEV